MRIYEYWANKRKREKWTRKEEKDVWKFAAGEGKRQRPASAGGAALGEDKEQGERIPTPTITKFVVTHHRLFQQSSTSPQRVIISQIFLCTSSYLCIKDRTLDVCMRCMERVHSSLCHFSHFNSKYMRDLPLHTTPTHHWRNSWSHLHSSRRVAAEISHLSQLSYAQIQFTSTHFQA